jgi:hypothetical protein
LTCKTRRELWPDIEKPQDDQDDIDQGEEGLPTVKNKENVILDGGVAEQPEDEEQPQDDGQEDSSNEGQGTADPISY